LPVYEFEGQRPRIGVNCYIHPEAVIIGDVDIGPECYIAPCAVLRGDLGSIIIGRGSNIQDNCTFHTYPGKKTILGERSHIGHGAILHSAVLGKHVTVGIGAIILDECEIGDESLIGAGTVLTPGTRIPPASLVLGSPGKVVRTLNSTMNEQLNWGTDVYQELVGRYRVGLKKIEVKAITISPR